jgi:hypothetical protein
MRNTLTQVFAEGKGETAGRISQSLRSFEMTKKNIFNPGFPLSRE